MYAKTVLSIGDLLGDAETDPVQRLEDMARLPFTTSDDLKRHPLRFLCVSQTSIERCVTLQSSGTTGPAKRLFFTREDLEHTLDFFHHGMSTLVQSGDRVMILLPGGGRPDSVADLLSRALARMDVQSLAPGPDSQTTLDAIVQQGVTCLVGAPVQVLALARSDQRRKMPEKPDKIGAADRRSYPCCHCRCN